MRDAIEYKKINFIYENMIIANYSENNYSGMHPKFIIKYADVQFYFILLY